MRRLWGEDRKEKKRGKYTSTGRLRVKEENQSACAQISTLATKGVGEESQWDGQERRSGGGRNLYQASIGGI